nr:unnamed protein product [Callosobruchus analis]
MEEENSYDPYVREQQRLRRLFEEVSSGEEDLQEPFEDDGEFGSDENYVPSETELEQSSSDADDQNPDSDHEGSDSSPGEERFDENDVSDWEETTAPIPDFHFDATSNKCKISLDASSTPLEVFEKVFTPGIIEYILECTNNYGKALVNTNRPKTRYSRDAKFRPISLEEIKQFFGLCLLQGQISTRNMRRYFSYTDALYFHPVFSFVMSGRRFEQILRVLCCSSLNSKVKNLTDMLISQFQNAMGQTKSCPWTKVCCISEEDSHLECT